MRPDLCYFFVKKYVRTFLIIDFRDKTCTDKNYLMCTYSFQLNKKEYTPNRQLGGCKILPNDVRISNTTTRKTDDIAKVDFTLAKFQCKKMHNLYKFYHSKCENLGVNRTITFRSVGINPEFFKQCRLQSKKC